MLKITDYARTYLNYKCIQNNKEYVRLSVKPSGCAGFKYDWDYTDDIGTKDEVIENLIVIHGEGAQLAVAGSTVDYVSELFGSSLKLKNPNVKDVCGCGVSFTV